MKDVTEFPVFEGFLKGNERSLLKVEVHWHITQSISVQDVDKGNMIITVMLLINFVTQDVWFWCDNLRNIRYIWHFWEAKDKDCSYFNNLYLRCSLAIISFPETSMHIVCLHTLVFCEFIEHLTFFLMRLCQLVISLLLSLVFHSFEWLVHNVRHWAVTYFHVISFASRGKMTL